VGKVEIQTVKPVLPSRAVSASIAFYIRMKTRVATALVVVVACVLSGGPVAGEEAPVVGTWTLLAFELHPVSGEVTEPFGPSPLGSLLYTAGGRMSVHLVQPGRPAFAADQFRQGSDSEVRTAFEGYFGYFGRYSVDVTSREGGGVTGSVTHHIEGCAFPNYIGTDRTRALRLEDNRLTLTTPRERDGQAVDWYRVVWERIP
jgi:hypothetical protein